MTRGFITVATGKTEYYQLAYNLLISYRFFSKKSLPFAILCDARNEFTEKFDDVVLLDKTQEGYLNKLSLAAYTPYDETIFIDADCLAYADLNILFDYFEAADDVSCFGRVLPLSDKTGWFEYDNLGSLKDKVSYIIGLHGGIYFIRKSELSRKVFDDAKELAQNYSSFKFKGKFSTPGDEPLIALAMAINQCKPISFDLKAIVCYWEYPKKMTIDISKGVARVKIKPPINTALIHWGTRFTKELKYQEQIELLEEIDNRQRVFRIKIDYTIKSFFQCTDMTYKRIKRVLKRTIKIS